MTSALAPTAEPDTFPPARPLGSLRWWIAMAPQPLVLHALGREAEPTLVVMAAAVVVAAAVPGLIAALIARGGLWFGLLLAALVLLTQEGQDARSFVWVFYPTAWTLLWLGRPPPSSFGPVAFRGPLLAAMLLGCADAFWLASGAALELVGRAPGDAGLAWLMAAGSAVVLAAVWGTSRLRLWGVLLALACNAAIVAIVGWRELQAYDPHAADDRWVVWALLGGGAVAHTLLQLPLLIAIRRGRPPRWARGELRGAGALAVLAIVLVVTGRFLYGALARGLG